MKRILSCLVLVLGFFVFSSYALAESDYLKPFKGLKVQLILLVVLLIYR